MVYTYIHYSVCLYILLSTCSLCHTVLCTYSAASACLSVLGTRTRGWETHYSNMLSQGYPAAQAARVWFATSFGAPLPALRWCRGIAQETLQLRYCRRICGRAYCARRTVTLLPLSESGFPRRNPTASTLLL